MKPLQTYLKGIDPYIDFYLEWLPYIPIHVKKDIMTIVRVGAQIGDSTRIRQKGIYSKINRQVFFKTIQGTQTSRCLGQDLLEHTRYFMTSETRRSILSMLLRCSPCDDEEEVTNLIEQTLLKEYHAGCTDRAAVLQYPFFMRDYESSRFSMSPELPYRPFCNGQIHQSLIAWKRRLQRITLYPQTSHKHVGFHTNRNLSSHLYGPSPPLQIPKFSTSHLERVYCDEGLQVQGPCEMRYAWKYNDLKPRVYYAMGGTAYHASKYVRVIFDTLMRSFKNTDPHIRTTFTRFPMLHFPEDCFVIYDYTAFTSKLFELRRFIEELSYFCSGTGVTVFDTFNGYQKQDLSTIIRSYNDICNTNVQYSVHRIRDMDPDHPVAIVPNYIAGLLGVYGNITASTTLHGIIGYMIAGDMDSTNAIGDDGAIVYNIADMTNEENRDAIRVLGDIADEKFEEFTLDQNDREDSDSWHFVKRSILVEDNIIKHGFLLDLPILAIIFGCEDKMHTVPLPTFIERRRLLIKQTSRLFDNMSRHSSLIIDEDIELILKILRRAYKILDLPLYGGLPNRYAKFKVGHPSKDRYLAVPALDIVSVRQGWFEQIASREMLNDTIITIPKLTTRKSIVEIPKDPFIGEIFESRACKEITLLEKLGFLKKEVIREDHLVTPETIDLYRYFLNRELSAVYVWTVIEVYHHWDEIFEALATDNADV